MKYIEHSHFYGKEIIDSVISLQNTYKEVLDTLDNISDTDLVKVYQNNDLGSGLSRTLNKVLKNNLDKMNWQKDISIFDDKFSDVNRKKWKLDYFSETNISLLISTQHSYAVTYNLMRTLLSGSSNRIFKNINTKLGILITITNETKVWGGFDSSIGTYEDYIEQCKILTSHTNMPIIIIGIEPYDTFYLKKENKIEGNIKFIH